MDANTSNLVVNLVTGFFSFFSGIYTSAKHRKIICCCCTSEVELKDDEEKK